MKSVGTIYGRLSHAATSHKFDHVTFYVVKSSFPPIIGREFLTSHPDLAQNSFALEGPRLKLTLTNGQQLALPWATSGRQAQSLLKTTSTAQLIKDLATNHHVTVDTTLFKGADLDKLVNLLWEYRDIFNKDGDPIGQFRDMVRIPTIAGLTKSQRERPIPKHQHAEVKAQIDSMAKDGIIEPCPDGKGFHSPLVIVKKKTGGLRICSDFKSSLNQCLDETTDIWPLPQMDHLFANIEHGHRIYTSLDVSKAYWNLLIDPRDRHKTNFTFDKKCWMYVRLPFGLKFSGDAFCRSISSMLDSV